MKRIVTRALIVVASILGIMFAQVAPASAQTSEELATTLGTLWTTVLETPAPENPFTQKFHPKFACFDLDGTAAPFGGGDHFSCKVGTETDIFVVGYSVECSTFDADCGRGSPGGCNGTTPAELLACAQDGDLQVAPIITIDGQPVPVTRVHTPETSPLNIVLPADNVFGEPAGATGLSMADGWVTQLAPLPLGNHTIVIKDPSSEPLFPPTTTMIKVKKSDG